MPIKTGVGLGSGIPIQELVQQSVADAFDPKKEMISARELAVTAKITTLGHLKSKLSDLKEAAAELSVPNKLLGKTANVQNNLALANPNLRYLTANVSEFTQPCSYDVVVKKLAVSDKYVTDVIPTDTAIIGTGTLNISIGDPGQGGAVKSFQVIVDDKENHNTLGGICNLINQQSTATGVLASLLKGDNGYFLSISSNVSGLPSTLKIEVENDNNSGLQQLSTVPNPSSKMQRYATAANGLLEVNGAALTISKNKGIQIGSGLTLDVYQETNDLPINVTVENDSSNTLEKIEKFVEKYNATLDYIEKLTKRKDAGSTVYDRQSNDDNDDPNAKTDKKTGKKVDSTVNPETGNGIFLGDATIRQLRRELAQAVATQINQANYSSMSQIGITSDQKNGKLKINKDAVKSALALDSASVTNLFTKKTTNASVGGVGVSFNATLDKYLSSNGLVYSRTYNLTSDLEKIAKHRLEIELQAKRMEYNLTSKYARLDQVLAKQKSSGDLMMQSLSSLQPPR